MFTENGTRLSEKTAPDTRMLARPSSRAYTRNVENTDQHDKASRSSIEFSLEVVLTCSSYIICRPSSRVEMLNRLAAAKDISSAD